MSKNKNVENRKAEDLNERWRLLYRAEGDYESEDEGVRVRAIVRVSMWVRDSPE
jgi:hypothetical protein